MRELCGGRGDCFTAGCGGGRSGQKKNGGRKKSDATLFLYEESGYRKSILPPHRIRLHRQERGQMGFICAKKKGQRRIPTALGSGKPATPKNNAYPFGCGCIRCLQKIYQIQSRQIQSFILNMLRTHAITVYCIAKVVKFPQSATTYLYWSRAAEPIAEKRHEGGVYGRIVSPRVFRAWGFAAWLRGSKKQAASRKGKPLVLCFLWNAYSLRGVTLTYDLPAPFLQNSTVPSTRAKSVWSLPIPTFSPGL